ncbi:MAG: hypothetical protein QW728_01740, partial [Thermoplasmata archaeon]
MSLKRRLNGMLYKEHGGLYKKIFSLLILLSVIVPAGTVSSQGSIDIEIVSILVNEGGYYLQGTAININITLRQRGTMTPVQVKVFLNASSLDDSGYSFSANTTVTIPAVFSTILTGFEYTFPAVPLAANQSRIILRAEASVNNDLRPEDNYRIAHVVSARENDVAIKDCYFDCNNVNSTYYVYEGRESGGEPEPLMFYLIAIQHSINCSASPSISLQITDSGSYTFTNSSSLTLGSPGAVDTVQLGWIVPDLLSSENSHSYTAVFQISNAGDEKTSNNILTLSIVVVRSRDVAIYQVVSPPEGGYLLANATSEIEVQVIQLGYYMETDINISISISDGLGHTLPTAADSVGSEYPFQIVSLKIPYAFPALESIDSSYADDALLAINISISASIPTDERPANNQFSLNATLIRNAKDYSGDALQAVQQPSSLPSYTAYDPVLTPWAVAALAVANNTGVGVVPAVFTNQFNIMVSAMSGGSWNYGGAPVSSTARAAWSLAIMSLNGDMRANSALNSACTWLSGQMTSGHWTADASDTPINGSDIAVTAMAAVAL